MFESYGVYIVVFFVVMFMVLKVMCDYIATRIIDHMEERGVFESSEHRDRVIDEVVDVWSSNIPIVDDTFWSMNAPVVEPTLDAIMSDEGFITVSASDCGGAWDGITVRTDIVRSDGNVVGEAVLKTKRWERDKDNGSDIDR